VAPIPRIFPNHTEDAGNIDTMQVLPSSRLLDIFTTLPLACLSSEAFATTSIFTGKERDAESGNDYFGARYFGSSMGRFLSPNPEWFDATDPQNPQSWNLYAYALNNPLAIVDPDGYDCVYLNDAGTGIDTDKNGNVTGIDTNSNSQECGTNGGYWVDGTVTHVSLYTNSNDVGLTGYTIDSNGNQTTTDAFYTNADTPENQSLLNYMGYFGYHGTVDMIQLANYRQQHPLAHWTAPSTSEIVTGCLFRGGGNLALDLSPVGIVPDLANAAQQGSVNPLFNSGNRLHDTGNAVDVADRVASALEKTLPVAKVAGDILKPVGVTLAVYKGVVDTYGCIQHR
jgi:RHS repeat-associated protein